MSKAAGNHQGRYLAGDVNRDGAKEVVEEGISGSDGATLWLQVLTGLKAAVARTSSSPAR